MARRRRSTLEPGLVRLVFLGVALIGVLILQRHCGEGANALFQAFDVPRDGGPVGDR